MQNCQTACDVDLLKETQGLLDLLTNHGFSGWMHLETDHSGSVRWRKSENVGEVSVQSDKDPVLLDSVSSDLLVWLAAKSGLHYSLSVVPLSSEVLRLLRREVLVQQELYEAKTISLLASAAAYCRAPRMWSGVSCG